MDQFVKADLKVLQVCFPPRVYRHGMETVVSIFRPRLLESSFNAPYIRQKILNGNLVSVG